MPHINRVTLENYKSIRRADLALSGLDVLIGLNGSGKSNLLSFFSLLGHVRTGNLQGFVQIQLGALQVAYLSSNYGSLQERFAFVGEIIDGLSPEIYGVQVIAIVQSLRGLLHQIVVSAIGSLSSREIDILSCCIFYVEKQAD